MNHLDLADALFTAFETGDADAARAVCHPDLSATQNHGPVMDLESLLQFALAVTRKVPDFRYEDRVRSATADGFVEEHCVCGTLPDGAQLRLPACVVAQVRDGRIVSLREYLDTGQAAGLLKALQRG